MKKLTKVLIICVSTCIFLTTIAPMSFAVETRIWSCMDTFTLDVQISNDWLRRSFVSDAVAININHVEIRIYNSFISKDEFVHCQYKSRNNDIPNLVYKFPCPKARKEGVGHRYWCTR